MNKTLLILALLAAPAAFAQSSNTTGATSSASTQAVNQPVQEIASYGSRMVGNAPSMAVGGSIGSHVCEASAGMSGGWFTGAAGGVFTYSRESCVFLNVGDFFQQSATMEDKSGRPAVAAGLRDASYELMAEIDPKIRAVLSRNKVVHGQAAVASDPSGTVGLQPQNYRVEAKP
jgi:hypothetical protein